MRRRDLSARQLFFVDIRLQEPCQPLKVAFRFNVTHNRHERARINELFERHFEPVYRFFFHKVEGDAVDLVQRTFLACVEARDRFRGAIRSC